MATPEALAFDHVIARVGAAGCVLARRQSTIRDGPGYPEKTTARIA
jgi:hypothetical protein